MINEYLRRTRGVIVVEDGWRHQRFIQSRKDDKSPGQLKLGLDHTCWGKFTDLKVVFDSNTVGRP